jgi:hypothetical protein
MGGVARVFTSIFKGVTGKKKPKPQKIEQPKGQQELARTTQRTSARLSSPYGTTSTLLGGPAGVTEQAKTSRTLLGS